MGCTSFFYPSSLWSFNKKENYSQYSDSLGKGSKHSREGQSTLRLQKTPFPSLHSIHRTIRTFLPQSVCVCVCI